METLVQSNHSKDSTPLSAYFSRKEWVVYALIVLIGIAFRWYALDMRPVHHDESQHGMFGRYYFDAPEHHYYKYNPMLHGPLLYNMYRFVYSCIGSDIWSFRVPMAFLGSLYMFLPLLFRRWFSPKALLFLTMGIALGPSLIYWSRFAREDFYVLFGMLCMLLGATSIFPRISGALVIFGITIQLCCKANVFVHLPIIIGFLVFEVFFCFALKLYKEQKHGDIIFHGFVTIASFAMVVFLAIFGGFMDEGVALDLVIAKAFLLALFLCAFIVEAWIAMNRLGEGTLLFSLKKQVQTHWKENLVGLFLSAVVYSYLYSAGGRYPEGIVAGLGGEAISYWIKQHAIERISGPFLFQFYTLTWYEFPFMIFFFLHLIHFYSRDRIRQYIGLYLICQSILVLIPFWFYQMPLQENSICKFLGVKDLRDLFGATILCLHPLIVTIYHLLENRKTLALWAYLFTSFFFSYSYLKEKVPWLSMYPLILGLIYLVLYFDQVLKDQPIKEWKSKSWAYVFYNCGVILILLGILFIAEGKLSTHPDLVKEGEIWENTGFLAFGLVFVLWGFFESKLKMLGNYNLYILIFSVVAIYNLRIAFIVNFVKPGHASEYISQVHTTPEFHDMTLQLKQKLTASVSGQRPLVLGKGESTWPITWYMAGIEGFNFDVPADKKFEDYEYVFDSWDDKEDGGLKKIPQGYSGRKLEFRGWWVPDFNTISFKRFLRYTINHTNWSPTGFTYVLYMSKNK
jgi:uncharacterized protein (TIGR03663 family)